MKKMVKKVSAMAMASALTLGMTLSAFATENEVKKEYVLKTNVDKENEAEFVKTALIDKMYQINGSTNATLYPDEVLTFSSTPITGNPDMSKNLTISPLDVDTNGKNELTITLPQYEKVGVYNYEIKEIEGKTSGVVYDTTTAITVSVLVTYDYDDTDKDNHHLEVATVTVTAPKTPVLGDDGQPVKVDGEVQYAKVDSITNVYNVGSLAVNKTVTGNLASETDKFLVDVTFESDEIVLSDIKYDGGTLEMYDADADKEATDKEATNADGEKVTGLWRKLEDGSYQAVVTIEVSHDTTITFEDIPKTVEYTVEEHDYTEGNANTINGGYEDAMYSIVSAEDAIDKKNTTIISGSISEVGNNKLDGNGDVMKDEEGNIVIIENENDTAFIVNKKGTTVDTGISLDSMPYLMTLALSAMGALGFAGKRRKEEDEI